MMRGSIRKRTRTTSSGKAVTRYHTIVFIGKDPETGKKRYDESRGYATLREAQAVLTERLAALAGGTYIAPTTLTVDEYVQANWLPTTRARTKATTARSYGWMIGRYVSPILGRRRLVDLTSADVNTLYARLLVGDLPIAPRRTRTEPASTSQSRTRGTRPRANRALSPKTVHNVHLLLHKILSDAVDDGLIQRNVAERSKPPRASRREIVAWRADELDAFLRFIADDMDYSLIHVASMTGMRRGELLGLRWADVDFERRRISVRRNLVLVAANTTEFTTPKNHQARVIDLDDETTDILRSHRVALAAARLSFGPGYERSDLVFPGEDGRPRHPDSLSRRFSVLRDRALQAGAVENRVTLHGLRHTHATIGLMAGVPIKVISERLGHASPAFTMAVYMHALPSMQAEAAATIAALVRSTRPTQVADVGPSLRS